MSNEEQFLRIGKIIGAHGLHGRLRILVISDNTRRFEVGSSLYLKIGAKYEEYISAEFIERRGNVSLLMLEGIEDRESAQSFKGVEIFIERSKAEKTRESLGVDIYYYYDLIGCKVFWKGDIFGEVVDIIDVADGNVLVLKNKEGRAFLIPFTRDMVDTKDICKRRIDINPVDGLFEL